MASAAQLCAVRLKRVVRALPEEGAHLRLPL